MKPKSLTYRWRQRKAKANRIFGSCWKAFVAHFWIKISDYEFADWNNFKKPWWLGKCHHDIPADETTFCIMPFNWIIRWAVMYYFYIQIPNPSFWEKRDSEVHKKAYEVFVGEYYENLSAIRDRAEDHKIVGNA